MGFGAVVLAAGLSSRMAPVNKLLRSLGDRPVIRHVVQTALGYRPYYYDRLAAGLDGQGVPIAWSHRITASSILARWFPPAFKDGLDPDAVEGAAEPPYAFPNILVDYVRQEPPGIVTGWWRGVGPTHNIFVVESFIDELAAAAKKDPVEYRRALLGKAPRARAVLDLATEKAGSARAIAGGKPELLDLPSIPVA